MYTGQPEQTPIDITLHDHLDGSRAILSRLPYWYAQMNSGPHTSYNRYPFDISTPEQHLQDIQAWFGNPFEGDIVKKFSLTTGLMQTERILIDAAFNYVEHRWAEGFHYCEATIAPQYHTHWGLTEKQVVDALIYGIKQAELLFPSIEVNLIFAVGREVSSERAVELVEIAAQCDRDYVVGIGLVCDETTHPPEKHLTLFERAKELGFKTTCHAGEFWYMWDNILTALYRLKVDRLDHATQLICLSSEALRMVAGHGIGVTGCPLSYLITGAVPHIHSIGIPELLRSGVLYSVHVDDDLFMPTMHEVVQTVSEKLNDRLSKHERPGFVEKLRMNAWKTKFGSRKYDNEGNRKIK